MKFEDVKYLLKPGDKVKVIKGEGFYAEPIEVVFLKEYTHHLLFEATFENKKTKTFAKIKFGISKASLWCGDANIKKIENGVLVNITEVAEDE